MFFNADNALSAVTQAVTLFVFSGIFWYYAFAAYFWAAHQPDLVAALMGLRELVKFLLVVLVTICAVLYLHLRQVLAERKKIFESVHPKFYT